MATRVRYVNTGSSAGGDGTTNATAGANRAYATLDACLDAEAADLTGITCDVNDGDGNVYIALDILCDGTAVDSTQAVLDQAGFVTDATHRIRMRTNGGPTGSVWDTGKYRLSGSVSYGGMLYINKALHVDIDLQVENTNSLGNQPKALLLSSSFAWDVRVYGGFYWCSSVSGYSTATRTIGNEGGTSAAYFFRGRNFVALNEDGPAVTFGYYTGSAAKAYIYNATVIDRGSTGTASAFSVDGDSGAELRFKNLLIQGPNCYTSGSPDEAVTILTEDTTSPTVGLRSKVITFADAGNEDFRLASGDTDAIGAGTDLSADTYWPFSTDGDGTTRSGSWDVGADEYVSASTTFYLLDSAASGSNFGQLQQGGSAPSTATTATGWTVDTVASSNYALMAYASERASTTFSGTAQPAGNPDNSLGDCFRSTNTLSGDFATGAWTIAVPVIAVSAAAGQDGRVRVRLWKSANATGTSPTEITAGAVAGTTVTNLATGAEQISTVTTSSITGFSMANDYLFVQIAWEITGAAT